MSPGSILSPPFVILKKREHDQCPSNKGFALPNVPLCERPLTRPTYECSRGATAYHMEAALREQIRPARARRAGSAPPGPMPQRDAADWNASRTTVTYAVKPEASEDWSTCWIPAVKANRVLSAYQRYRCEGTRLATRIRTFFGWATLVHAVAFAANASDDRIHQ